MKQHFDGRVTKLLTPRILLLALGLFFGLLSPTLAYAQELEPEPIGTLSISDLFLAPRFTYSEPAHGHFQPGDSYIAVRWRRDDVLSAQVLVGTESLVNVPNRYPQVDGTNYKQVNGDMINVVEAYGQIDSSFGRFRFGLVPIPFGSEGGVAEGRLRFPRSLIFEKGLIGLRDHGVSYSISHDRFYSDWAIHNGESGRDLDNQMWFTARWGYVVPGRMRMGVSGQTGRTTPRSTDPLGNYAGGTTLQSPDAIMDLSKLSKWRIGNGFINIDTRGFGLTLEGTFGDVMQESRHSFVAGHSDIYVPITEAIAALARYDLYDPRTAPIDKTQYGTIGLSYRTQRDTSEIYVFGTQQFRPAPLEDIHRFMIMWKLTPQIYDRR